jgi:hypothetical protein
MSDMTIPTPSPLDPPTPPLNLGPFAVSPPSDMALRQTLQAIGVQVSVLMMNARMTPEEVAVKASLPQDLVYQIMVGIEPNIGLGTLSDLAKLFGTRLAVQLQQPSPPQPPSQT